MEHEKAGVLRRNLSIIISGGQHCLHVAYMQAKRLKLLMTRHQEKAIIKSLIKVGHSAGMEVHRYGSSEEHRQLRSVYCAHRALTPTLSRGNLGQSVILLFKKKRAEVEGSLPVSFYCKWASQI